jgi:hypothetical protein
MTLCDAVHSPSMLDARAVLYAACRHLCAAAARRLRVWAAFFAEAERSANERAAEAAPPLWPPFFAGAVLTFLPRPDPLCLPPPVILFTVAQARRLVFRDTALLISLFDVLSLTFLFVSIG